jgi:predicted nucleotidyltransferase component of viral defense system
MVSFADRVAVEFFHLVFLRALVGKGQDKSLFALKGGCNLRFYFDSVRYSEDIDFDVTVVAKATLRNKVDRLLESPLVAAPLKTRGLEVAEVSAPKQTETTQRWKVGLRVTGRNVALRTKIEFSRRGAVAGTRFEVVSPQVLRAYALSPFLATHYDAAAAISQKIEALAGRAEPQARDIFDLNLLLARPEGHGALKNEPKRHLPTALEHALEIGYDQYAAQVVAFLDPALRELFESRDAWDAMQHAVVGALESAL